MFTQSVTPWEKVIADGRFSCQPLERTEAAEFYWSTDCKTSEIIDAFSLDCRPNMLARKIGPALFIGCDCRRCGGPIYVFSRVEAERRWLGLVDKQPLAAFAQPDICKECSKKIKDADLAAWRAQDQARERRSRELGTMLYREYLKTPEWAKRREQALQRAKFRCQVCSSPRNLNVHHRTYVRRGREHANDLTVLCRDCHTTFHQNRSLADRGRAA